MEEVGRNWETFSSVFFFAFSLLIKIKIYRMLEESLNEHKNNIREEEIYLLFIGFDIIF